MKLSLIFGVLALTAVIFYSAIRSLPATDSAPAVASSSDGMESATAQIEAARADFDEQTIFLNKTIADLEARNLDQASNLEATLTAGNQLQSELDQAAQQLSVIEAVNVALETGNGDFSDALAALSADLQSRDAALGDAETTTQALNDAIEEGREEIQTLQVTVTDLELEGVELTRQVAELESNAAELQSTPDDQIAETEALLEQNTIALDAAQDRIALLTEVTTVQVQVTSDLNDEIAGFEAQVTTLTNQASSLSDAVAKRDTVIAGLMLRTEASTTSLEASCQERSDAVLAGTAISFNTGTTAITDASIPLLEELANIASDCAQGNLTLEIEGHTDNASGVASNLLLSDGRAKAVRDFLEARGVPALVMRAVGFGGSEPIADNDTSDGQLRNQRIVFDWEQS